MVTNKKGMMFVLSSPSGVGKTTLTKKLAENNPKFVISISHTTRSPRPNEIDGQDYHFINLEEFQNLINKKAFYEFANIFENYYGTHKETVIKLLSQGKDVLFDIDWQGTQQLKKIKNLNIITIFILPPNIKILKDRLLNRHKGQEKIVEKRMKKFNEELSHWKEYNYVVINDDLNLCYEKIKNIINLEKKGIRQNQNYKDIESKVEELIQ